MTDNTKPKYKLSGTPKEQVTALRVLGVISEPLKVGMKLTPALWEMTPWGTHGIPPDLTILTMGNKGYWARGEFICACGNKREVAPGDWMHTRKCFVCKPGDGGFDSTPNMELLVASAVQANQMAVMLQSIESLKASLALLQAPTAASTTVEVKPEVKS